MSLWGAETRRTPGPNGRVVAHILDPITGYSNRDLQVGKEIDPDTVRRLGENGAVFLVVSYEGGVPTATLCTRAQWLKAQAREEASERPIDARVWRKREELPIG